MKNFTFHLFCTFSKTLSLSQVTLFLHILITAEINAQAISFYICILNLKLYFSSYHFIWGTEGQLVSCSKPRKAISSLLEKSQKLSSFDRNLSDSIVTSWMLQQRHGYSNIPLPECKAFVILFITNSLYYVLNTKDTVSYTSPILWISLKVWFFQVIYINLALHFGVKNHWLHVYKTLSANFVCLCSILKCNFSENFEISSSQLKGYRCTSVTCFTT